MWPTIVIGLMVKYSSSIITNFNKPEWKNIEQLKPHYASDTNKCLLF
jgi:hypothetical protein